MERVTAAAGGIARGTVAHLLHLPRALDRGVPLAMKLAVPVIAVLALFAVAGTELVLVPTLRAEMLRTEERRAIAIAETVATLYESHRHEPEGFGLFLSRLVQRDPSLRLIRIYRVVGGSPAVWASSRPEDVTVHRPEPHDIAPLYTGSTVQEVEVRDGEDVLETVQPLRTAGALDATVGVYSSLDPLRRATADLAQRFLVVALAAAALQAAAIILVLEVVVLRPLRRLHRAALRVAAGDLSMPPGDAEQPDTRDEIALVAREFDRMVRVVAEREDAAELLATTDGLTGLLNRRAFDARLELEIGRATRLGYPLALSLVDLDGFKALNDSAGHPAGDEALRRVGRALTKAVRRTDVVARYGGDEFAVIHPACDALAAAVAAARARAAVERLGIPVQHGGTQRGRRPLSASVGIAEVGPEGDARALLAAADAALYRAKASGGLEVAPVSGGVEP